MHLALDLITAAGTLILIVLGLALILGLMDVVNLAHTGFMAVGVYLTVTVWQSGVNIWLAMLAGTASAALLGAVVEWLVVRRLYGRPLDTILATWGISLMVVQAISWAYGRGPQTLNAPLVEKVWLGYSAYRLMILLVTALLVFGLYLIVRFTEWGLIVRMVMANEQLAQGVGINTTRVRQITFVLGAALAGAAGALLGPLQSINPNYGVTVMVPAFLAVLLSGKTLAGLVVGCSILAMTQTLFALYANPIYAVVAVIVMAVALLRFFPEGLVWRRS
ncbi:MAG: branched-chain amino acid ABC transporter permease [Acidobacteria bacterium]|nr:branched-chain amino acid ABC transporter permease [Acidobacteriota bacterium]